MVVVICTTSTTSPDFDQFFNIQQTLADPIIVNSDQNMKNDVHSWVHTLKDT
jgi:hypothetical protein